MGSFFGRKPLLCILLGALLLRIGFAVALQWKLDAAGQKFLIAGDAEGYWELGRRIAAGEPYEIYHPPARFCGCPASPPSWLSR